MEAISEIIAPIFRGVLLLSVLVFVHEGGHFLAARACGVRVTELFLGMPCRFNVHFSSKRIGTKFGVTPLLIGGYAAICGMDPQTVPCAPAVLAAVHRHGTVSVSDLARELELDPDDVLDACAFLLGWGSIAPVYEDESKQSSKYYPMTYASMPRDAAGNTVYDGKAFDRTHSTKQGDAWVPPWVMMSSIAASAPYLFGQGFLEARAHARCGHYREHLDRIHSHGGCLLNCWHSVS